MKKTVCIILVLGFTAAALSSCAGTNGGHVRESGDNMMCSLEEYTIVRPDAGRSFETDAAVGLRGKISERFGITLPISTDWVARNDTVPTDTKEILVGYTNRDAEDSPVASLDKSVYYLSFDGTRIRIAGGDSLSIEFAVYKLLSGHADENGLVMENVFEISEKLSDSELTFIRKLIGAAKYVGLADELDEADMTHGDYKLVWSDEFDGDSIDKKRWNYEYGYIANNELQCYTDRSANSWLSDGCLVIQADEEKYDGFDYTSARLNTSGKFSFKYGYIEMRAILPEGKGMWPAFWMLGQNGQWPECGEIDIMEMIGGGSNDDTVYGTLHYGTVDPYDHRSNGGNTYTGKDLSDGFHTYALEWMSERIVWYFDGKQFFSTDISGEQFDCFRNDFFIILNFAVGGDWPGSPDATTQFPGQYVIDYVRVYQ